LFFVLRAIPNTQLRIFLNIKAAATIVSTVKQEDTSHEAIHEPDLRLVKTTDV